MKNHEDKENRTDLMESNELQEPPLYQVLIHNDDFTPMEFVVGILEKFFFMERKSAVQVMMEAHETGIAACGLYSKDYAQSKVSQVLDYSGIHEHPLLCSTEAAL